MRPTNSYVLRVISIVTCVITTLSGGSTAVAATASGDGYSLTLVADTAGPVCVGEPVTYTATLTCTGVPPGATPPILAVSGGTVTTLTSASNVRKKQVVATVAGIDQISGIATFVTPFPDSVTLCVGPIAVDVVNVNSITVSDSANPAVTVTDPSGTELFVAETAAGTATIRISTDVVPADPSAEAIVFWRVTGDDVTPPATGNFGAGDALVTLTPTVANREYTVDVGCDDNLNGALEAGEVTHTITVHVVKMVSLTVADNANSGVSATDASPGPDLFVCETPAGNARIDISSVIDPPLPGAQARALWTVRHITQQGSVVVATGNFAGSVTPVTLIPEGGDRTFVVEAGIDGNANGTLDQIEIEKDVFVHVVKVTSITVSDSVNPLVTATSEDQELAVCEDIVALNAQITIEADIVPTVAGVETRVLWEVTGATVAAPDNGDFSAGDPVVTLTPADGNRTFVVSVGCDADADGILDIGEVSHSLEVHVVRVETITVVDTENPNINATNPTEMDLYLCRTFFGFIDFVGLDLTLDVDISPTPNAVIGARVLYKVEGGAFPALRRLQWRHHGAHWRNVLSPYCGFQRRSGVRRQRFRPA